MKKATVYNEAAALPDGYGLGAWGLGGTRPLDARRLPSFRSRGWHGLRRRGLALRLLNNRHRLPLSRQSGARHNPGRLRLRRRLNFRHALGASASSVNGSRHRGAGGISGRRRALQAPSASITAANRMSNPPARVESKAESAPTSKAGGQRPRTASRVRADEASEAADPKGGAAEGGKTSGKSGRMGALRNKQRAVGNNRQARSPVTRCEGWTDRASDLSILAAIVALMEHRASS
jgi:hypothetical protein